MLYQNYLYNPRQNQNWTMENSNPIKDPQTFRNLGNENRVDKDYANETALNSLHYSSLADKSNPGIHCPCGNIKDHTYNCEICQRLRLACPYSSASNIQNTSVNSNKQQSYHRKQIKNLKKAEGCKICQQGFRNRTASFSGTPSYNRTPKMNLPNTNVSYYQTPLKRHRIVEQIIYYPVFHNIYEDWKIAKPNPESIQSIGKNGGYLSPQYKYRHRSGTTNQPTSSPIKIEDYDENTILTPQRIKKLTESMIS